MSPSKRTFRASNQWPCCFEPSKQQFGLQNTRFGPQNLDGVPSKQQCRPQNARFGPQTSGRVVLSPQNNSLALKTHVSGLKTWTACPQNNNVALKTHVPRRPRPDFLNKSWQVDGSETRELRNQSWQVDGLGGLAFAKLLHPRVLAMLTPPPTPTSRP
jgi:hypothetical protein